MTMKYKFASNEEVAGRFIRCPRCNELLSPADIESYLSCPYCSLPLERNVEMDDFVMDPMVQNWLSHFSQTRPDGRPLR